MSIYKYHDHKIWYELKFCGNKYFIDDISILLIALDKTLSAYRSYKVPFYSSLRI